MLEQLCRDLLIFTSYQVLFSFFLPLKKEQLKVRLLKKFEKYVKTIRKLRSFAIFHNLISHMKHSNISDAFVRVHNEVCNFFDQVFGNAFVQICIEMGKCSIQTSKNKRPQKYVTSFFELMPITTGILESFRGLLNFNSVKRGVLRKLS